MNRRRFLTRALASVPVVVAGEQLVELLAPRKTIFLPPRGGWTAPTIPTGFALHMRRGIDRVEIGQVLRIELGTFRGNFSTAGYMVVDKAP